MPDEAQQLPAVLEGTVVDRIVNAKRQPIVPAWIRDDVTRRAALRFAVVHVAHLTAFHGGRLPKYACRTAMHAPRGLFRTVSYAAGWVFDADAAPLRREAVTKGDHAAYAKLDKMRAEKISVRGPVAVAVPVAAAVAVLMADALLWPLFWLPVALTAFVVLGYLGRPLDRVWLDVPLEETVQQPLTADVVIRALTSLGIAAMAKPDGITFAHPVMRDGPGWRADVNLPYGVAAVDVIERRDRLASGLRRPLGCVWPETANDEHPGRLVLWVGYQAMDKARQPAWPLANGTADLFKPVPFALDQRGRIVTVLLMFAGMLIGAMPRMGKTMALRILGLAAALDVTAEIRAWELKGTGDLSCLEHVAHEYGSGADDETLAACLESVRYCYGELDRRAKVIRGLPKDLCPENKVTPDLAKRRSLGLHPLVLIISECQEAFTHPQMRDEFDRLTTAIVKRGPALGIIPLLDTQRPDAKSLPSGISANIPLRFCLRVMGQIENDMVLGTSMYRNGIRATTFSVKDKGIGYLAGEDDPQVIRTFYIDQVTADRIGMRARKLREAAGTLSGYAAGEPGAPAASVSLLADVASVVGADDRLWSETICARLAELRPGMYADWSADQLARALAPYGVDTGQVWASGKNRRGVAAADVRAALAARSGRASR